METSWQNGPHNTLDAHTQSTFPTQRLVLAVVHHQTAGTRLLDFIGSVEKDHRVQVVWTVPPVSAYAQSGSDLLAGLGARTIPWNEAQAFRFDLAVAASKGGLERLHAPVLVVGHGHGPGKLQERPSGVGPLVEPSVYGTTRADLTSGGRVIPSLIGIAHERHRAIIEREVPEAGPLCRVVGDPCLDRLVASRPHRVAYRRALDVAEGQRLIVVSSTLRRSSLLGSRPDLPAQLLANLPHDRYRIALVTHSGAVAWHGRRQLTAWHSDAQRDGLLLIPSEEGWRGAVIAADLVVADHGSVPVYAGAIGRRVLSATFPRDRVLPGSAPELLADHSPALRDDIPLREQVVNALTKKTSSLPTRLSALVTSAPGESIRLLRSAMYELMDFPEPRSAPRTSAVPLPVPLPPLTEEEGIPS
ncbi:hypothetical protein [Nocardiopsis ansamitocini]|uniref:Glycosyltransferase n=1 Tax=Nocardiopsis ansamitocini TaxID=1670832 RepID=A0A9W6UHR0_9ACTN|nr:hypothetical protein [Nocardiopsis ansamitocini]GLU46967.1 hypothetical protein Nans01_13180 [Nocardiopsis ansamitocini]